MNVRVVAYIALFVTTLASASRVCATPPWASLLPFRRVEADPKRSYELSEQDGPWLILAASFSGQGAEQQAGELIHELRKSFRLPAYLHRQQFDFSETFDQTSHVGHTRRMKYDKDSQYEAIAVLVGNFPSIDDPDLEKTLEKIKYARPACLDLDKRDWSSQRFIGLRELYRRMNGDEAKRKKGPMGSAFATRNPMLPKEYFAPGGVDDFVSSLNKGVKHSLLKNPGKVTVRVASFRGDYTINMSKIAELEASGSVSNKLEIAADQAHRMAVALRKREVEAYEFHDRHESVVTIGSFESEGKPLADGTVDIDPAILRIMQSYGASKQSLPGQSVLGLMPRSIDGIPFDIQPLPIKVPRRSIGSVFARSRNLFR